MDEIKKRHRHGPHREQSKLKHYSKRIKFLEALLATKTTENERLKSLLDLKNDETDKLIVSNTETINSLTRTVTNLKACIDAKTDSLRQSIPPIQYESISNAYKELKKKNEEMEFALAEALKKNVQREKELSKIIEKEVVIDPENMHTACVEVARILEQTGSIYNRLYTRSRSETEYLSQSLPVIEVLKKRLNLHEIALKENR